MKTEKSYLNDTYQFEEECRVIHADTDSQGFYVILDKTIFYPQGGGQPSDQGILRDSDILLNVRSIRQIGDEIRHYVDGDELKPLIERSFNSYVNQDLRLLHAKLHTAGHLISHFVETRYPDAKTLKGHHFPGEAYVEFKSPKQILLEELQAQINEIISKDQEIKASYRSKDAVIQDYPQMASFFADLQEVRTLQIGDFPYAPCGGTHVKNTNELKGLTIGDLKCKGDTTKVKYDFKS